MLARLDDLSPADWILPFADIPPGPFRLWAAPDHWTALAGCLPDDFEAYGKIFHPIYRDPEAPGDVSWASAADAPPTGSA